MPAVTVDDFLTLSKLPSIPVQAVPRPVRSITTAPRGFEGEGFPVYRAFQGVDQADLDPFVHLDQMGEVEYAPGEPKGTPWHPHRGFETVTYMIDGTMEHQDTHGGGGVISNGDTQWMTAGSGLLHIETPPEQLVMSGGLFHGFQLWVNLPSADKFIDPQYQDLRGGDVALLASRDGGAIIRLIAGDIGDVVGPGSTHTPITIAHCTLRPGARIEVPWRPDFNALAYVLNGRGKVGIEGRPIAGAQLALYGAGDSLVVTADESQESRSPDMDVLLLGGRPIREPVAWSGPFVMNTHDELVTAYADYEAGRLGVIPTKS